MTGLWQVEARDNPSYFAYRHLDLFYVENWSLGLDVTILVATARTVVGDAVRSLRRTAPATDVAPVDWPRSRRRFGSGGLIGPWWTRPGGWCWSPTPAVT